MPFTRAWDETVPPGSAARNTVATLFRNLKVDLRERFENGLVVDFDADPLVIQPAILGNVTGKLMNIHWSAFSDTGFTGMAAAADGSYVQDTGAGASNLYAPLILPTGATITEITFIANQNAGAAMAFNLIRVQKSTGAAAGVFATVNSSGGYNGFSTGVVSHVVDSLYFYALEAITDINNRLYGACVKYDTADSRMTL